MKSSENKKKHSSDLNYKNETEYGTAFNRILENKIQEPIKSRSQGPIRQEIAQLPDTKKNKRTAGESKLLYFAKK